MRLGTTVNSAQEEMEGTTVTIGFTALSWHFLSGTGKMIQNLNPSRTEITLHYIRRLATSQRTICNHLKDQLVNTA
jgi:hypothetical protein